MIKDSINLWKFYRFCIWCGNKIKADEIEIRLLDIYKTNKIAYYMSNIISLIKY